MPETRFTEFPALSVEAQSYQMGAVVSDFFPFLYFMNTYKSKKMKIDDSYKFAQICMPKYNTCCTRMA